MLSRDEWRIGACILPSPLVRALNAGRWQPPLNDELLANVFGETPDGPQFYDYPTMVRQNRSFQQMTPVDAFSSDVDDPGIDPASAVLIGDLGADMPIALDYRASRTEPCVLYLTTSGWREVASSFDVLFAALKL